MNTFLEHISVNVGETNDGSGIWLVHALEYDVMTQGESYADAIWMLTDALNLLAETDGGIIPCRAPHADWLLRHESSTEYMGTSLLWIQGCRVEADVVIVNYKD